jgi:acyl carrier protein
LNAPGGAEKAASAPRAATPADPVGKIFASVLRVPPESISDATSPTNTSQWDSLQSINLVMALEEEFGIRLGTRDIAEMKNVGLLKAVLRRKGVADI